jgi:hypothetical protein
MSFMWAVGINITSTILLETPVAAVGYGFLQKSVGYLYFTPLVAVALGEFFGHFFNDFIANRYVRKHNGVFKPEARLLTNYIAAAFMIPGLVIVGQTLEKHLSYAGIVMGWGMYVFGVMLATVAITAYALDSYGSASSEVAGLLNFARGKRTDIELLFCYEYKLIVSSHRWFLSWLLPTAMGSEEWLWPLFRDSSRYCCRRHGHSCFPSAVWRYTSS